MVYARSLYGARDLLWSWTRRTIQGRYQQSALGWLWAVIQPAATVFIFSIIFTMVVPIDTGEIPYVVFSFAAVTPWTFLATSLTDMSTSLVQNMTLVTKIYFPREALPIAAMLARLMDFGIAAVLLLILVIWYQLPVLQPALLFLPLIILIQIILIIGIGLTAAALNVFFRDVQPLMTLGIQLWFYASPIIYPVTLVPEWLRPYYYLNPMAGIIQAYRNVLLFGAAPESHLLLSAGLSVGILAFGYWLFKRLEFQFADIV